MPVEHGAFGTGPAATRTARGDTNTVDGVSAGRMRLRDCGSARSGGYALIERAAVQGGPAGGS